MKFTVKQLQDFLSHFEPEEEIDFDSLQGARLSLRDGRFQIWDNDDYPFMEMPPRNPSKAYLETNYSD